MNEPPELSHCATNVSFLRKAECSLAVLRRSEPGRCYGVHVQLLQYPSGWTGAVPELNSCRGDVRRLRPPRTCDELASCSGCGPASQRHQSPALLGCMGGSLGHSNGRNAGWMQVFAFPTVTQSASETLPNTMDPEEQASLVVNIQTVGPT